MPPKLEISNILLIKTCLQGMKQMNSGEHK